MNPNFSLEHTKRIVAAGNAKDWCEGFRVLSTIDAGLVNAKASTNNQAKNATILALGREHRIAMNELGHIRPGVLERVETALRESRQAIGDCKTAIIANPIPPRP